MPSALTQQQKDEFRARLQDRRAELIREIREELLRSGEAPYIELAGQVHDTGDESMADILADLSYALTDRHVLEVQAVEHSLGQLARDEYGVCADCGQGIGLERLRVVPTAIRCLDCQTRYERNVGQQNPSE